MFPIISPEALAGAAIGVAFVVGILEAVKRTLQMSPESADRFGPVLAVIIAVILTEVSLFVGATAEAPATAQSAWAALLQGVAVGLAAVGLYNAGGKEAINSVLGDRSTG